MVEWSTDKVQAGDRFAYWREVICDTLLNVSTEAPPEVFSARIVGHNFGKVRCASFDCVSHELIRNHRHVARAPEDTYVIALHRRGQSYFNQDGETVALGPNEMAIVDGRIPFHTSFSETVSRSVAVIPHAMIDRRAPWLASRPRRKIKPDSAFAELARRHLEVLTVEGDMIGEAQAALLTENLCNLLALASADDLEPRRLDPELRFEAMLVFCRQHLRDPELSPRAVASQFGISVRTLHMRFEKLGRSFGRWLLDNRLEACSRILRDPHQQGCSISEIAYGCGFNDLSHFNRVFRARFNMSPRQWRSMIEAHRESA